MIENTENGCNKMVCNVNGLKLYYQKSGTGPPLLLLHGNGQTHKIFDKAVPELAKHFSVYAIDSRGHGQSDFVSEYHYTDIAEDVKCFIENQCLDCPILYGLSDGGIIGLLLACKYPHLLSQIIISGANIDPAGIRIGWLKLFQFINAIVKEPKMDMMLAPPGISVEMLNKIDIPATLLVGSRDMVKKTHTEYIAQNIKNCKLRILRGEGHGSYVVHSTKIVQLILDAVNQ